MKKLIALILLIILIVCIYVVLRRTPKNYSYEYSIQNYKVQEKFEKNKGIYYFSVIIGNDDISFSFEEDYHYKRKLIKNIKNLSSDNGTCISVDSLLVNNFSICKSKDGEYRTPYFFNVPNDKKIDTFENIKIYDIKNHSIFVWNYNNLIAITPNKLAKIKLFDKDVYDLDLYAIYNKDILFPDYNQNFSFNKMYLFESDTFKINTINMPLKIYFDSFFLPNNNKDFYLFDKKENKEYRINPYKKEIKSSGIGYYENNTWKSMDKNSILELESSALKGDFYFEVKDNYLYYVTPTNTISVSNIKVDNLIISNEKEAFFISSGVLYVVNYYTGINKALEYKEWNFNPKNVFAF